MNAFFGMGILLLLLGNGLLSAAALRLKRTAPKTVLSRVLLTAGAELTAFCGLYYILCCHTLCENMAVPLLTAALTGCVMSAWVLLGEKSELSLMRFLRSGTGILCLALLLELAVCNFPCYTLKPVRSTTSLTELLTEPHESAAFEKDTLVISGNTALRIPVETQDVRYIQLDTASWDGYYHISCSIRDDNFSRQFVPAAETVMNASQKSALFAVNPHGTLHEIRLQFEDVSEDWALKLRTVTFMNVKPYSFSLLRVLLTAGVLLLCAAVKIFGWHKIDYDDTKLLHREAAALVLVLSIVGITLFCNTYSLYQPYDADTELHLMDPYAQTLDAWQKGQLHLDLPVDEALAALENPYDVSARAAVNADVQWDRAYYQGRYYSYFGVAPVLFVYYPVYLLTGNLPSLELAACIFAVAASVCLFGLIMSLVKRYCKKVKLLLLLCGLAAAEAASGLFFCVNFSDMYYLAFAAGICFLYLFLWLGFAAVKVEKTLQRCLLLAGCGAAVVCTVISRPNMALYALLLVPPFLTLIRRRTLSPKEKAAAVSAFFVPLCIGAAGVMAYNAARFSSPFDFGTAYQLTVSDTSANTVRLSAFPAMLASYFCNPAGIGAEFPFLRLNIPTFPNAGQYVYADAGFGILMFPCIAAAAALLLPVIRRSTAGMEKWFVYRGAFVLVLAVAFLDFCLGGYNLRYQCDVLPVLAVFSVMVLLETARRAEEIPAVRRGASGAIAGALLLTPLFLLLALLAFGTHFALWNGQPSLYFILRELLVFWQ